MRRGRGTAVSSKGLHHNADVNESGKHCGYSALVYTSVSLWLEMNLENYRESGGFYIGTMSTSNYNIYYIK